MPFNSRKTKLISFHHHHSDPSLHPVHVDSTALNEAPCLEKLLGLKLTPDLKWNDYITSIAKEAAKMVGNLYRLRKFLTPSSIAYLFKSQIRPRMEYCCHIWAGASESSLSKLDKVQIRLRWLIGNELFNTLNHFPTGAMLQVCPSSIATSMVNVLMNFILSHPFFVDIPKIKSKLHMDIFSSHCPSLETTPI